MPRNSNDYVNFIMEREADLIRENKMDFEEVENVDRITWHDVQLELNNRQRHAMRDTSESEE